VWTWITTTVFVPIECWQINSVYNRYNIFYAVECKLGGKYIFLWYLRYQTVFETPNGIWDTKWYLRYQMVFEILNGIWDTKWYLLRVSQFLPDTRHIIFFWILYHIYVYQGLKLDIISYLISLSKKWYWYNIISFSQISWRI
jgi:hypothetical protein